MPKRPPSALLVSNLRQVERTAAPVSPLMLCDQLIRVAQEADRAGYSGTAAGLVELVYGMFDTAPQRH